MQFLKLVSTEILVQFKLSKDLVEFACCLSKCFLDDHGFILFRNYVCLFLYCFHSLFKIYLYHMSIVYSISFIAHYENSSILNFPWNLREFLNHERHQNIVQC